MKTTTKTLWAVYCVAFDDSTDDEESRVIPYVGKEKIETTADPEQVWYDVNLAIAARGGDLLTIIVQDELHAEAVRIAKEAEILRRR